MQLGNVLLFNADFVKPIDTKNNVEDCHNEVKITDVLDIST